MLFLPLEVHIYTCMNLITASPSLFSAGPVKLVNANYSCKKLKKHFKHCSFKGVSISIYVFFFPSTLAPHFVGLHLWLLGSSYIRISEYLSANSLSKYTSQRREEDHILSFLVLETVKSLNCCGVLGGDD